MAVTKQVASKATLKKFLAWAARSGYKVGEHPDYGTVHPVHMKGSWHYEQGAADLNFGSNGPAERAALITAMSVAESLGLAVTFARDGSVGSAAGHKNHLHVDVGSVSNYGRGNVAVKRATTTAVPGGGNVVKGNDAIAAVQSRLKHGYPAYAGNLVVDGIDGPATKAAVREFQRRSGLVADGIAGPRTRAKLGLA